MCRIVQDVRTCLIRHTKGPGKCVRLYRMSEPVQSDTPRDQGNVSDCTGCQNLSNPTHQGTREMCQIVQDVRTCPIRHTKGPGECDGLYRMSEPVDWTGSDILYNPTHFPGPLVCLIRQVLTSCTIRHISLVPWCV
jgi:hypothetical protein